MDLTELNYNIIDDMPKTLNHISIDKYRPIDMVRFKFKIILKATKDILAPIRPSII